MLSLNCSLWNSVTDNSQMRSHTAAAFQVMSGGLVILSTVELELAFVTYSPLLFKYKKHIVLWVYIKSTLLNMLNIIYLWVSAGDLLNIFILS